MLLLFLPSRDISHSKSATLLAKKASVEAPEEARSSCRTAGSPDWEVMDPQDSDRDVADVAILSAAMPEKTSAIDVKKCYIKLERCDHLIKSPQKVDESINEAMSNDEAEWRETLVSSLREDDQSESPDGFIRVYEAIQLAVDDPKIDSIETAYAAVIKCLGMTQSDAQIEGRSTRVKNRTKRDFKWYQHARTQDLFKKDLAKHVRLGTDHTSQNTVEVSKEDIRDLYNALWGIRVPTRIPDFDGTPSMGFENFGPITETEIKKRITTTKRSTAPGPDGVKRNALLGVHKGRVIAKFFNLILFSGILPVS